MGKWHTNVQLTLKQMRTAVLELALCQAKLQLQIRHPAWLSDRKPAPDLAALLHFSTTGGLFKAAERVHENRLFHFLFQHQRCKEANMQPRNGAVNQLGFSEHLTDDTLPCMEHSSCWGWLLLLGASSQVPLMPSVLCSEAQLNDASALGSWHEGTHFGIHLCPLHQCCAPHDLGKLLLVCKMCNSHVASLPCKGVLGTAICWDCGRDSFPSHGQTIHSLHL